MCGKVVKHKSIKSLKVPVFIYCIARPSYPAEMGVVHSSFDSGCGDTFEALWEVRLWLLVMLASWAAASWALVFSFFSIFTRIPVSTELRNLMPLLNIVIVNPLRIFLGMKKKSCNSDESGYKG